MAYNNSEHVIFNTQSNEYTPFGEEEFLCDTLIAPTIAELRKKGYETSECCSGHSDQMFIENYEREETLKDGQTVKDFIYEMYTQGWTVRVTSVEGNKIKFVYMFDQARTYVFFPKFYSFNIDVPDGFELIQGENYTVVRKWHKKVDEKGCYVAPNKIKEEIRAANEQLLAWAKALSYSADLREGRKIHD